MSSVLRLFALVVALLIGGPAWAQDTGGWLGVDAKDVSKVEADRLGWENPHGAKLGAPVPGSPAEKFGLKAGDIVLAVDRTLLDLGADLDAAIAAKSPGSEVRLQVLSGGRERRVNVTLSPRPNVGMQAVDKGAMPHLMLDTGGHMSIVKGLAFTPDGSQLVSAGEDKVVRVWDWKTGKTLRIIRGQVGLANEGQIFGMALSPDGQWLATGGWMRVPGENGHMVRLYEFSTGRLVALLRGHTNIINTVAFSPDSRLLISGASDNEAIIWDVQNRRLQARLVGHKDIIHAVAFMPDGRALTGSNDGTLRLWNPKDGKPLVEMTGHKGKIWNAIGVRPSDGMIASGDNEGEIRLWNGAGAFIKTLAQQKNSVGSLTFTKDGKSVLAGTGYQTMGDDFYVRVYEIDTGKNTVTYPRHNDVVVTSALSPDGSMFATGGGDKYQVQLWNPKTGETKQGLVGSGKIGWAVGFSPDSRRIAWGGSLISKHVNDRGPLEVQLQLPSGNQPLGRPEPISDAAAKTFVRAEWAHGPYSLDTRRGGNFNFYALLDIKKDGKTLATVQRGSADGYDHRSFTFSPDGQTVISGGSNGFFATYDLSGKKIGDLIGHEGVVWALATSPDGRYLVSGNGDQTIRLWNLKTRELIVNLYYGNDGEWVIWTPQGYYTGSPGSDKIVGWQINKGPEVAADYVGADQLRQHLNRPDIVERAIILASAEQAVREAPGTSFKLADLLARPVPRFKIASPDTGSSARGGRVKIKLAVEPTSDPVKVIRVQVNGLQVDEITPEDGTGGFSPGERLLDVPLSQGRNNVRITLSNDIGDKAETVIINHEGDGDLDKRGTLYILAIGVDRYPALGNTCGDRGNASCDLTFSGADARRIADAAERRLGPSHTNVIKRVLVNGAGANQAPTASNILDAIDLIRQAKETDTVMLFIAGHGVNDGPNYRFLPTNAERIGDAFRGATVVSWQVLQEAVEQTKGRRILFIDTCHSGNAYNQKLGNAAYHANIIAYTSARFDQAAMEDASLGHGLFTYAVVEGLDGKGDLGNKSGISTKDLADYVIKRVEQLAKQLKGGDQEPQYFKGRDAQDYVLAK